MTSVVSSTALILSRTLSAVKPNCVRMKAGDLSRMTARCSEKAASSAVIGLPEGKTTPSRILKVKVLPSSETVQDSAASRSEEHTSELQSLMRISYAVFCLKTKTRQT